MRGCVFKRVLPSGRISWGYSLDVGDDANGKRRRLFKSGFERQLDAQNELTRILTEKNEGLLVKPEPRTFSEFVEEWFREHAEPNCEPKTVERYRQLVSYVLPDRRNTTLTELSALTLERLYNRLRRSGGKRKRRCRKDEKPEPAPLSARTVKHIAGLVHTILGKAVRWKLLKTNPADACDIKTPEKREARALDAQQTDWYLDAARGQWLYPILVLAAATGCRRGELLALTWSDLILQGSPALMIVSKSLQQTKGNLRVKAPKNGKARRIPLPAFAVDVILQHRSKQKEHRKAFGATYNADLNLVFATPEGEHLKPDSVTAKACFIAKRAGLSGIGLHSLRHSHGSQLLAAGVPLPTVSKRLGHSSVNVTASIYSHAFTQDELAAAEVWDQTIRRAAQSPRTRQ